jgi:hypothetical protein
MTRERIPERGSSATVSARALKLAGNCFRGFFHHYGMSAQRIATSSTWPPAAGPDDIDRISGRNVVVGLGIPDSTRKIVQVLDFRPLNSVE